MKTIDEYAAEKKAELDQLRPLTLASATALAEWYDVELTYTSTAIEGNSLTRVETAIVLDKGITVAGKPLRDHIEVLGHKEALNFVHILAEREEAIREIDIRRMQSLVVSHSEEADAGRYSPLQRVLHGSSLLLPSPAEIGPLMSDFGQWLSKMVMDAESAFAAHEKLVAIHPFTDGNGRTARLLMNLILIKGGYPPVVIGPEQREAYIKGLDLFPKDPMPYREFMTARLDASLDHHLCFFRKARAS